MRKYGYFVVLSVLALFLTMSCNIGLGEAVDTQEPKIDISYPPISAVVRDDFVLGGSWSDDGSISSINITVKRADTKETKFTTNAQISAEEKTWKAEIPVENLLDGTYEIQAQAKDSAGHSSGVYTRTLDIDNTAPVLLLSKPATTGNDVAITAYGRDVKVTGDLSDDHEVKGFKIHFIEANIDSSGNLTTLKGSEPVTIEIDDFGAMSSDSPLVVASYYSAAEVANETDLTKKQKKAQLRQNYLKIYTNADDIATNPDMPDKGFYCGIELTDNAKVYKKPFEDEGEAGGNKTTRYYIKSTSLYDTLMKKNSQYELVIGDLKKIINGTSELAAEDQTFIKNLIDNTQGNYALSEEISADASSKFKLSPNNNPTFNISNYEYDEEKGSPSDQSYLNGYKAYILGNSLYLNLNAGKDQVEINPNKVSVYLDHYKTAADLASDTVADSKTVFEKDNNAWPGEDTAQNTSLSASLKFENTDNLQANEFYKFRVEGEDIDGNVLLAKGFKTYGFYVKPNAVAPTVDMENPDQYYSGTQAEEAGIEITGKATFETARFYDGNDAGIKPIEVTDLQVTNISTGETVTCTPKYEYEKVDENKFKVKLTKNGSSVFVPSEKGKYKYVIKVKITDSNKSETTARHTFYIDNKEPEVKINSITPIVKQTGTDNNAHNYVNGKITLSVRISDNNELAGVKYEVYSDGTKVFTSEDFGAAESLEKSIDTTQNSIQDLKNIEIKIIAEDSVGNKTVVSSKDYCSKKLEIADETKYENFIVKQETDRPEIKGSNFFKLDTVTEIKTNNNLFGTESNNVLMANISDDDGIKKVTVSYKKTSESDWTEETVYSLADDAEAFTTYSLNYTMPSAEGKYDVKISVEDSARETTSDYKNELVSFAGVSAGAPKLSVIDTDNMHYIKSEGELKPSGTASSGVGFTLYRDYDDATGTGTEVTVDANNKWEDLITAGTTNGSVTTVKYTAVDEFGVKTSGTYKYTVDTEAPEFISGTVNYKFKVGSEEYDVEKWYKESALGISGYCKESLSGMDKVEYKVFHYKEGTTEVLGSSGTITVTQVTNETEMWEFKATASGFTAGTNYISLTAWDNAGNKLVIDNKIVKVDMTAPSVSIDDAGGVLTNCSQDIEASGKFSDDASGVKEIAVTINGSNISENEKPVIESGKARTKFGEIILDQENGTWSLLIDADHESKWCTKETLGTNPDITVKITDNAGNYKEQKLSDIVIDMDEPELEIARPAAESKVNKKIKISGTSYDANKLDKVTVKYQKGDIEEDDSSWADVTEIKTFEGNAAFNWNVEFDTYPTAGSIVSNDGDPITIWVEALDKAGNKSVKVNKVFVDQNSDRPVISFVNLSSADGTCIKTAKIDGNISDDDGNIKVLKISDAATCPTDWTNVNAVTVTNGSFSFTPANEDDGTKNLWLYVEDAEGGIFITDVSATTAPDKYKIPYVKFSGQSGEKDNNVKITYIKDATAPAFAAGYPAMGSGKDEAEALEAAKDSTSSSYEEISPSSATSILGGTEKRFAVIAAKLAEDASGIESVSVTIEEKEYAFTEDAETHIWYSSKIDASKLTSGTQAFAFKIIDKSGSGTDVSKNVNIDNLAPVITVATPSTNLEQKNTTITLTGSSSEKGNSQIKSLRYLIPDNTYYTGNAADGYKIVENKIKTALHELAEDENACPLDEDATVASWSYTINNLPDNAIELANYNAIPHTAADIYSVPVYFYISDKLGNESIVVHTVTSNPYADRPVAKVNYPSETTSAKPLSVNGNIRLSGSATDNTEVKYVYLQFDVNKDGKFNDADKRLLEAYKDTNNKILYKAVTSASEELEDAIWEAVGNKTNFWGIKATLDSSNWYLTINENMEFQTDKTLTEANSNQYAVAVRAVAVDNNIKFGAWSEPQYLKIDTNIPVVGQDVESIVEFDEAEEVSQRKYEPDMYLKGVTKLRVSVADKDGIKKIMYYVSDTQAGLNRSGVTVKTIAVDGLTEQEWTSGDEILKGYVVDIPLSTAASTGTSYIKVVGYKQNDSTSYKTYNVNFDNTAPSLDKLTLNSTEYDAEDASTTRIVNSNARFALGGAMTDMESGFEKIGFFFIRGKDTAASPLRIYDPMIDGNNATASATKDNNRILVSSLVSQTEDGVKMYGIKKAVTVSSATVNGEKVSKVVLGTDDAKIKAGGLVYIGGTYLVIGSKEGKTLTLKSESAIKGSAQAFFPIMQIVNNTGAEKTDEDGITFPAGDQSDDGDGMPESIIKSNRTWSWDATFRSDYIPDGPGRIVVFAWDKAGNVKADVYAVSIQNNSPRLVKMYLGTDINGSGKFEKNEFVTYDVLSKKGEQSSYKDFETYDYYSKSFKVLNRLAVVPEFVGGNLADGEEIKAVVDVNADESARANISCRKSTDTTEEGVTYLDPVSESLALVDFSGDDGLYVQSETKNPNDKTKTLSGHYYVYTFENDELGEQSAETEITSGKGKRAISFTFWDKTEDTDQGIDSNFCFVKLNDLVINTNDVTPPNVVIDPFYWNDKDDNSLYENSYKNGHIELPEDLKSTLLNKNVGFFDKDPKVSGKISIRGTAYDEHSLKSLWVSFSGFYMPDYSNADEGVSTTFDPNEHWFENEADHSKHGVESYYYKVAEIVDGEWKTASGKVNGNGWNFTVSTNEDDGAYSGQDGNRIAWQLDIDTNGITTGMLQDARVYVAARDASYGRTGAEGIHQSSFEINKKDSEIDGEKNVPYYQMDVVPYITGIKGASRSRLGRYSVQAGAEIEIEGWNFGEGALTVNRVKSSGLKEELESTERVSATKIKATAPQFSGALEVNFAAMTASAGNYKPGVNAVHTLNNENGVPSYKKVSGKYVKSSFYNIEEGEMKKDSIFEEGVNFWTDDRYLSVWNVNTEFKKSTNPRSGVVKKIATDKLYLKDSGYSVQEKTGAKDTHMALWSSDDLQVYRTWKNENTTGTERLNTLTGQSQAQFSVPVPSIDYCLIDGHPWYVALDNYVGGPSANSWGMGLFLARDNYNFDKSTWNGTNTNSENEYYNIIERQGYNNAAESRNSSEGYDSVLEQFKNPRITGYKGSDNKAYIYVSYYDSYARCLKYAAYKADNVTTQIDTGRKWGTENGFKDLEVLMRTGGNNRTNGKAVVAGEDTTVSNPTEFAEEAGEWNDILVDGTIPVIVYYNKTKQSLEIARGSKAVPEGAGEWVKTTIKPEGTGDFGRYCSAAIDKAGIVHVAAQDADNATLWYLQLKKSGNSYTVSKKVLVDATKSAGRWTDIELTNPDNAMGGDKAGAVISCIDTSFLNTKKAVKVCWYDAEKEAWESMTDPAKYEANDQRTSVMADVFEAMGSPYKATVAVGYNSNMLAVDFLRAEE